MSAIRSPGTYVGMVAGGSLAGYLGDTYISFADASSLILEHVPSATAVQKDFMLEPVAIHDGVILPPTAPGLGVEISEALLAK